MLFGFETKNRLGKWGIRRVSGMFQYSGRRAVSSSYSASFLANSCIVIFVQAHGAEAKADILSIKRINKDGGD